MAFNVIEVHGVLIRLNCNEIIYCDRLNYMKVNTVFTCCLPKNANTPAVTSAAKMTSKQAKN